MARIAALLPDAVVRLPPALAHGIDERLGEVPQAIGEEHALVSEPMDQVHDGAEHVELQLVLGEVADADRTRTPVAIECRDHGFGQELVTGQRIQRAEALGGRDVGDAVDQPVEEAECFARAAHPQQRIGGDRGVA